MPDITMCRGIDCPLKDKCYRYTAKATPQYQSYFTDDNVLDGDQCEYFWDNE